ncbi:MAG: PQQ-binding-like beta-propeller repeat protein [Planctomycetes bacterium]|nr:PQQ-binding-like beta-propeller repeat protein [Planctomycetota bacterium]
MSRRGHVRRLAALAAAGLLLVGAARGQEEKKSLLEQSAPLRTALHHDPALEAPLERLMALYQAEGRLAELLAIYRNHLNAYPNDARALTVYVRLLTAAGDPAAAATAKGATEKFPDNGYLHFLLYRILQSAHDPAALDALDAAIDNESIPGRKRVWIDLLLPDAIAADRRPLAEKHFAVLAELAGASADGCLDVARKMLEHRYYRQALELLQKASALRPSPETFVDIELSAAAAEAGLDRMEVAGRRLDSLLSRVTAEYWRRPEILRRRMSLVQTDAERKAMLDVAEARMAAAPHDEAAALDLADLQSGFGFRRKALEILIAASDRMPASMRMEKETLALFDLLRDERGREEYLAGRIKALPEREDLVSSHIKSLFLLSRRDDASAALDALTARMPEEVRSGYLIEMARYLRRSSLLTDAAGVFEKALEIAPLRLDVRRELGEVLIAVGRKRRARELFQEDLPPDAPIENLLDIVLFMIGQEMFTEAGRALVARQQREPTNMDIRLLLLKVQGSLGEPDDGRETLLAARRLADTPAGYRQWLEAGVAFHDAFGSIEEFLKDEGERLAAETAPRADNSFDRKMIYADVASKNGLKNEVALALQNDLAGETSLDARVKLRRRLIDVLGKDKKDENLPAREAQLKALIEEDPAGADEYTAMLALAYSFAKREDLAVPLLEKIDVFSVRDPIILNDLVGLYKRQGRPDKLLSLYEHLTASDPTNRRNWEEWLAALACTGSEAKLRSAARRLLAGVDRMPVSPDTRRMLNARLLDSYWRSIGRLVWDGEPASSLEALALAETVERMTSTRNQWLWATWVRAYLLNSLGRTAPRDEAVAELSRVVKEIAEERRAAEKKAAEAAAAEAAKAAEEDGEIVAEETGDEEKTGKIELACERITFPDGMSILLDSAASVLTSPPAARTAIPWPASRGPKPPFRIKWIFDAGRNVEIVSLVSDSHGRAFLLDSEGNLFCIDTGTGKLLWQSREPFIMPPKTGRYVSSGPPGMQTQLMAIPTAPVLAVSGSDVYVPEPGALACLAASDGGLKWRVDMGGGRSAAVPSSVRFFVQGNVVTAYDPQRNRVVCLDAPTGKVRWEQDLPGDTDAPINPLGAGAAVAGSRLLAYGPGATVVNTVDGRIEWVFDSDSVRQFPVEIKDKDDNRGAAGAASVLPGIPAPAGLVVGQYAVPYPHVASPYAPTGLLPPVLAAPATQTDYTRCSTDAWDKNLPSSLSGTKLVAPAVCWASAGRMNDRTAVLAGHRLLLFGDGLLILDLDMPLKGRHVDCSGMFIGMAGPTACLVSATSLRTVNVDDGSTYAYDLKDVTGGSSVIRVAAAVDGPLVYVAGPNGILCFNVGMKSVVFLEPWPEGTKDLYYTGGNRIQYHYAGISETSSDNAPGMAARPPVFIEDRRFCVPLSPSLLMLLEEDR